MNLFSYKQNTWCSDVIIRVIVLFFLLIYFNPSLNSQCSGNDYDSGGASGDYSNYENVTKTFSAPVGSKLLLTFNSFNLENNYDFLYVYDGSSTNDPLLAVLTGSNISGPFVSSGNSLTIRFTSDYSVTKSGWNISLSCLTILDCTNIPSLDFINPTLISGSYGAVGSKYRFDDVLAGAADAIMTIQNKSHSDISIYSLDETSATFGGYEEAFQPIIDYNWVNGGGNFDPPGDKFVTFKVDFVSPGTTTPVIIPQLAITGIDIDGSGQPGEVREFIRSSGYQSYSKQSTSTLSLSGALKAQGPITNYPNIDDTALDVMLSFNFSGVSSITFDYGGNYGGANSLADSGVGNSDEKRHNSLYFKCYGFDETVCQPVNPPTGTGASRCGPGPVQLNAGGCNGTVRWYESANGGVSIQNGSTFITPILNNTKTYYIECYDVGCVSDIRTAVTATILDSNCSEICDNGIDDDGDNLIDCYDLDCGQVLNRNFDEGTVEWFLYNQSGNSSSFTIDANSELEGINSAYIDITSASGTDWNIQFGQGGLDIESGKTYVITFDTKATSNRPISLSVQLDQSPWTSYFYESINISDTDSTYSYEFVANTTLIDDINLLFNLGQNSSNIWIDNVQFKEDCKVCEAIPDTILSCIGLVAPTSFNLPDPLVGDTWSVLHYPSGSFPIINASTGLMENMTVAGQYTAIISGPSCIDTVDVVIPMCDFPCLCDDSFGQGFADWSNLGIVPVNGPTTNSFSATIPGHSNVNVTQTLSNGGESYWGGNVFTEPDRGSFTSLNYIGGPNNPIYLETGANAVQSINFDFSSPMGDFDLLLFDIDQNDEITLSAIDANGNTITDFSKWVIRGIGDATMTEIGGDHLVAPFPNVNLSSGVISSSNSGDFDQNFIAIRPDVLIDELTINYTSTSSGNSIFIDIYGTLLASACGAQDNTNCLSEFNLVSFGNVNLSNSDIQGKACFCDTTILSNYSIGASYPVGGNEDMVYIDGAFTMTNGSVQGGYLIGSGPINLSSVTNEVGNFTAPIPVTYPNEIILPVDCAIEKQYYEALSNHYENQAANGTFTQSGGVKYFNCNNLTGTVYFDISLSDFSNEEARLQNYANAEAIIINFLDTDPNIYSMPFDQSFEDNSYKIIFNFPNASRVRASAVGIKGTILAPYGVLVMENGHVDGNVIVNGFTMNDGSLSNPNGIAGELHTCVNEVDCSRSPLFDAVLPDVGYTGCKFHIEQDEFCVGETVQLFPNSGVVWSSDNPTIASISDEGLVTSHSEGVVHLTYIEKVSGCPSLDTVILDMVFCVEICHDGIDNDGDGLTDCDDPDCETLAINATSVIDHDCFNDQSGIISLSVNGGIIPYAYEWSDIPDPIAYWGFNGTTNDISGNLNHENKSSSIGLVQYNGDAMEGNSSIAFDGNTYLRYSIDSDFMEIALTQWMVAFWMKPNDLNGEQYIFDEGGGTNGLAIRLNNTQLEFAVRDNGVQINAGSHVFPNDNQWHYVLAYYQDDSISIYLDGVKSPAVQASFVDGEISSHSGDGGLGMLDGGSAFGSGSGNFYEGLIDGFKYYANQSFTLEQIDDLARNDGNRSFLASGTYEVTIKDGMGQCYSESNITVGAGTTAVDLGPDISICRGNSTVLSGSISGSNSPFVWNWNQGLGQGNSKTVSPSNNTTYLVTVTDNYGCTATDEITVIVNDPLNISIDLNGTICLENDSKITANVTGGNGVYLYNWSGPNSFSSILDTISIADYGNYYLTVSDATGCQATTSGYVYQSYNPFIITLNSEVCEGDSVSLEINSGSAVSYQWSANAENATTNAITVAPQPPSSTYLVTITNDLGCSSTAEATIDVTPYPVINISGSDSICETQTTMLVPSSGGTWVSNNPSVATITNGGIVTGVSPGTSTFTYTEVSSGCDSEASLPVTVLDKPEVSILGPIDLCLSDSSQLSPSSGGVWSSSDSNIATISNSGVVLPITAGNVTFEFVNTSNGCISDASAPFTINPKPIVSLNGNNEICQDDAFLLSPTSGGTWTTTDSNIATVANSGEVNGIGIGDVSFIYSDILTGCLSDTLDLTIKEKPIITLTGPDEICEGFMTTMASSLPGNWISNHTNIATIDGSGTITAVSAGTAKIIFNSIDGCVSDTSEVIIHPVPQVSINGNDSICIGFTTNLLPNTGGTWISNNPTIANVNDNGLVTGVSHGSVTFVFTSTELCSSNPTAGVYIYENNPITISGNNELCVNGSTQLSASFGLGSGTWVSSDPAVAEVDINGLVTAISPGNAVISYAHNTTECYENPNFSITVYPNPTINIGGSSSICQGTSTFLTTNIIDGIWSSSNYSVASITPSGIINGLSPGKVVFYVTNPTTGCISQMSDSITINPPVGVNIDFNGSVCLDDTSKLTAMPIGGTSPFTYSWTGPSSFSSNLQTIDISANGNYYVTVVDANGCNDDIAGFVYERYDPFIFNLLSEVCEGQDVTLSVNSGTAIGYQWGPNAGNVTSASVNVTPSVPSSIYSVTVTNDLGCKSVASAEIDVIAKPSISVSGPSTICDGDSTYLLPNGEGAWTSSNISLATVNDLGKVYSLGPGSVTFTYQDTATGCYSDPTTTVTMVARVPASLVGPDSICVGELTSLSPTSGGVWVSSDTEVATVSSNGQVTGKKGGSATFSFYEIVQGCKSVEEIDIEVIPLPQPSFINSSSICIGDTVYISPQTNGSWISDNPSIATISDNGMIVGLNSGYVRFQFTDTITGCISSLSSVLNVNQKPTVDIGPEDRLCVGSSLNISPSTGGTWVSSDPNIAAISNNGLVTGVNEGAAVFTYFDNISGCPSDISDSIFIQAPPAISYAGQDTLCLGEGSSMLPSSGGYWVSSDNNIATINPSGQISTHAPGDVVFNFITQGGICVSEVSDPLNVKPLPSVSFNGPTNICEDANTVLIPNGGGVWQSSNSSIASVNNMGVVTGISGGTAFFYFTSNVTGCTSLNSANVTVYPKPVAVVNGDDKICIGETTNFIPATGGVWQSSNSSIATITTNGFVTGISSGTANFVFTETGTGCVSESSIPIVVSVKPSSNLAGASILCEEDTSSLFPASGGTWTSNNTNVATVTNNGIITAVSQGIARFTFTTDLGCSANETAPVTVYGKPTIFNPGDDELCVGDSIQLLPGNNGTWSSSNVSLATINNMGTINGISPGNVRFAYTDMNTGCISDSSEVILIKPKPAINLLGDSIICVGTITQLSPTSGGLWVSNDPSVATINNSGIISGLDTGTVDFYYLNLSSDCISENSIPIVIAAKPVLSFTEGTDFCIGDTTFILPSSGGVWTSTNPAVASINNNGRIVTHTQGVARFIFQENGGCQSDLSQALSVNVSPIVGIYGSPLICVGNTAQLYPSIGGTWESSDTLVATVDNAGLVTGLVNGTANFTYTDNVAQCSSNGNLAIDVELAPSINVEGDSNICIGFKTKLTTSSSGIWVSSNPKVASVSNTGEVTGLAPGKTIISFIDGVTGCSSGANSPIISVNKCLNHDFNVTRVNFEVAGNISTNDFKPINITYGHTISLKSKPTNSNPSLILSSDGTYVFSASESGKYNYEISVCQAPATSGCITTFLEFTVLGNVFSSNNPVNNLEFATTFADQDILTVGQEVVTTAISNDKCIKTLGCNLDEATLSIFQNSNKGSDTTLSGGKLWYRPNPGFIGNDTVTYMICTDEGNNNCSVSKYFLTVNAYNADNSVVAPDDFDYTLAETNLSGNVMLNDSDPEGDTIRVVPVGSSSSPFAIEGGSYYIDSLGDFTFIPNPGFIGNTEFIYTLCDNNIDTACMNSTMHIIVFGDMSVVSRVYLEGALMANNNATTADGRPLMRDNLRNNPYTGENNIPLIDPYSGYVGLINLGASYNHVGPGLLPSNQAITDSLGVFSVEGRNAIVDWIFLELRSKEDSTLVFATRSALVQRDGDIVDLDGVSPVKYNSIGVDSFYLVVNHRTHLGAMSQLVSNETFVDFTSPNTPMYDFGSNNPYGLDYTGLAMNKNAKSGYMALWSGDSDNNGKVKFTNPEDDQNMLFFEVLFHFTNLSTQANYDFAYGYAQGDFNMNGKVKFTNPSDDKNMLFGQIVLYPLNYNLLDNFDYFIEQIPK